MHTSLILFIILVMLLAVMEDRKAFPPSSRNILVILSSLFTLLIILFLILGLLDSLEGGHWSGRVICGPEGCAYESDQLVRDLLADTVTLLTYPSIFGTITGASYLIITGIRRNEMERRTFEASGMLLLGSLLFSFIMIGNYKIVDISFIAAVFLSVNSRHYRYPLYIVIILLIIFILLA